MTENQEKAIFRDVYNFYCKNKNNGCNRDKWLICAGEVNRLCEKYKGTKLFEVLIQGVYAQLVEDNTV